MTDETLHQITVERNNQLVTLNFSDHTTACEFRRAARREGFTVIHQSGGSELFATPGAALHAARIATRQEGWV